jgi:hypothetical protein
MTMRTFVLGILVAALILIVPYPRTASANQGGLPVPRDCEIYAKAHMAVPVGEELWQPFYDKLEDLPGFEELNGQLKNALGIELNRGLFAWVGKDIHAAVVRTGEKSVIGQFLSDGPSDPASACNSHLKNLGTALEMYATDHKGLYPTSLNALVPSYLKEIPPCPLGKYWYRVSKKKDSYKITIWDGKHPADQFPSYDSQKGLTEPETPRREEPSLKNYIVAISSRDNDGAKSFVDLVVKSAGRSEETAFQTSGHGGYEIYTQKGAFSIAIVGSYVVMAENLGLLQSAIESYAGKPDINANDDYRRFVERFAKEPAALIFVNVKEIISRTEGLSLHDEKIARLVKSLTTLGFGSYREGDSILTEMYLLIDPQVTDPAIRSYLEGSTDPNLMDLAKICPASITTFQVADLRATMDLIRTAASMIPEAEGAVKMVTGYVESALGVSLENELLPAMKGGVAVTYELSDWLLTSIWMAISSYMPSSESKSGQLTACKSNLKNLGTAMEMYSTDHSGRYPKTLAQLTPDYLKVIPTCPAGGVYFMKSSANPDSYRIECRTDAHKAQGIAGNKPFYTSEEGLGGTEGELPPEAAAEAEAMSALIAMPMTLALRITEPAVADKLVGKIKDFGGPFQDVLWHGVTIYKGKKLSYARMDDLLLIATGKNIKLLKKLIQTVKTNAATIDRSAGYTRFMNRLSGKVVAIQHHKVDWMTSILRGVGLFFGNSDYREKAATEPFHTEVYEATIFQKDGVKVLYELGTGK